MKTFGDGYTGFLQGEIENWGLEKIWELEDTMSEKTVDEIVGYLKDVRCTATIGLQLRRYICGKFCDKKDDKFIYTFADGTQCMLNDYMKPQYDITQDEVSVYVDVFWDIKEQWSHGLELTRAEAKRMLTMKGTCTRARMFELAFALHMNAEEMHKFLTDVLAEQTYNFRKPSEIIAFYCHSHENENTYQRYTELMNKYECESQMTSEVGPSKTDYTKFATQILAKMIHTEDELLSFLRANSSDFTGKSETAYAEFMDMLDEAMENTMIYNEKTQQVEKATNTEQLAKAMLRCIPRATFVRHRRGKDVTENEFVPIHNGENAQETENVMTVLPKDITEKLLKKDRIDDIKRKKVSAERKDLIYLRFYLLYVRNDGEMYTDADRQEFIDECNDMLLRCGMSPLYPGNRFENLILLTLYTERPFEIFEDFVESTFHNEPKSTL